MRCAFTACSIINFDLFYMRVLLPVVVSVSGYYIKTNAVCTAGVFAIHARSGRAL